LLTYL
jgi:hypothetical protein